MSDFLNNVEANMKQYGHVVISVGSDDGFGIDDGSSIDDSFGFDDNF